MLVDSNTVVVLEVTKEMVLTKDHSAVMDVLMPMVVTKEAIKQSEGKVIFLFDGWNDDPREIYQIPELVFWFRSLRQQFPYLLHVTPKERIPLTNLFFLLCRIAGAPKKSDDGIVTHLDQAAFQVVVLELLEGTQELYDSRHVEVDYKKATIARSLEAIKEAFNV